MRDIIIKGMSMNRLKLISEKTLDNDIDHSYQ